jgi:hypothetical protein
MAGGARVIISALAACLTASMTASAEMSDISGTWVLNPDLSDSPRQKLDAADRAQPLPRVEGRPDEHERARVRDEMRRALDGPARMTVKHDGRRFIVVGDDGTTQTFEADNRAHRSVGVSGVQIERRTRWDDGALVSEVSLPGGSYTQTWQRKGPLLTLTTRFSWNRGGSPIVGRRVYERAATVTSGP